MTPFDEALREVIGYAVRSFSLFVIGGMAFVAFKSAARTWLGFAKVWAGFLVVGWFFSFTSDSPDLNDLSGDSTMIRMGINQLDWDEMETPERDKRLSKFQDFYRKKHDWTFWIFYCGSGLVAFGLGRSGGQITPHRRARPEQKGFPDYGDSGE